MKIYLDNSVLNRPFDDPAVSTNRIEAEILFLLIELVKKRKIQFVNSAFIELENSVNPFPERKVFIAMIMRIADSFQNASETVFARAGEVQNAFNLAPLDALHIAAAETAEVDFFITSDYTVIKRYKGNMRIGSPAQFLHFYEERH